jgi:uncharacterized protein YbjQ (UPF0145 family)
MEFKHCPNCQKKIGGLLSSNYILDEDQNNFIRVFHADKNEAYCYDCGYQLVIACKAKLRHQKEELKEEIALLLTNIPIVTLQNPKDWDYTVVDMVTAQSVSGTGIVSEIASSWTDLLGGQSDILGNKLSNGEQICKNQLRLKALNIGANCIIATDIDYAEVGGTKGMLMVCMSGTAVVLNNIHEVLKEKSEKLLNLQVSIDKLDRLKAIKIPVI